MDALEKPMLGWSKEFNKTNGQVPRGPARFIVILVNYRSYYEESCLQDAFR